MQENFKTTTTVKGRFYRYLRPTHSTTNNNFKQLNDVRYVRSGSTHMHLVYVFKMQVVHNDQNLAQCLHYYYYIECAEVMVAYKYIIQC